MFMHRSVCEHTILVVYFTPVTDESVLVVWFRSVHTQTTVFRCCGQVALRRSLGDRNDSEALAERALIGETEAEAASAGGA